MAEPTPKLTYRNFLRPIPPPNNLSNISFSAPTSPCAACATLIPDRTAVTYAGIATTYALTDTFPSFPSLSASAAAGCGFCALLRSTLVSTWGSPSQPAQRWGSDVDEGDPDLRVLLDREWDGRVTLGNARFEFVSFSAEQGGLKLFRYETTGAEEQQDGNVLRLLVDVTSVWKRPEKVDAGGDKGEDEEGEEEEEEEDVEVNTDSPIPAAQRRLPSPTILSDRNIALMKDWISSCQASCAESCEPFSRWSPTRLLDLSSGDTPTAYAPLRLVESPAETVEYAALSYAWADDKDVYCSVQAEESNLDELRDEGVDIATLPRAFADAVAVCRALGLRYLWIDRLCVLQDSAEDRFKEDGLLYKIFHHAKVTLAATGVTTTESGFLTRDTAQTPATKLSYSPTATLILSPSPLPASPDKSPRDLAVDSSPWALSARNLLQRIHSTRLIYFPSPSGGGPDIFFECRWGLRSETIGSESVLGRVCPLWARSAQDAASADDETKDRMRAYTYLTHQTLLEEFTTKAIADPAARLLLMSNPASDREGTIADVYVARAGLFQRNLAASLLWAPIPDSTRVRVRLHNNRSPPPSWSWGSVHAPIEFPTATTDYELPKALRKPKLAFQPLAIVGEAAIPAPGADSDPLQLYAKGFLKKLQGLRALDTSDPDEIQMRAAYPYDLVVVGDADGTDEDGADGLVFAHGQLDLDDQHDIVKSAREFAYLHINTEMYPTGLILMREPGQGDNGEEVYRRVGVADIAGSMGGVLVDPPFVPAEHKSVCLI